ncbi:uncharacterized protein [Phyllobates terribilis]|uniref:uncharacterized protein n=1 Tax=Phyllobates terribilis TaxID=111132 RepID=UPI003CCAE296
MTKTLYHCRLNFIEAFEEMLTVSSEHPENLEKAVVLVFLLFLRIRNNVSGLCHGGVTSTYRRHSEPSIEIPIQNFPPPPGHNAPEQVHLSQGDMTGRAMIVSWVTPVDRQPNKVVYWKADEGKKARKHEVSESTKYKYYKYTSGHIHHALLKDLEYDTKYFYEIGARNASRRFWFTTPSKPGPDVPYTFGIIGDLGQTYASNQTLEHYMANPKGQAVLFVGDLSYADDHPYHDQNRWDSWGRFVEKRAAYQAWIWCSGNHEMDNDPEIGEFDMFKAYTARYHVPYKASNSQSPLWYSIKRGPAHIIVLSSYSAFVKYTPQYNWLQNELPKVNRSETPWLIVLLHAPLYNSNNYHYKEGEAMRVTFEPWFVQYKVDLVLAGHVHSYERSHRVSNIKDGVAVPVRDMSAPVYLNLGDGGNIEGAADDFMVPMPEYSAVREASFGHGVLEIKNRTHAHYAWHRNQDDVAVMADSVWFTNRVWLPLGEEDLSIN